MARAPEKLFLERESYRRRRLGDAARLVPVLGVVLLLLPGLWTTTADALIYIFTVWAILIVVIGSLSRSLMRSDPGDEAPDAGPDPGSDR